MIRTWLAAAFALLVAAAISSECAIAVEAPQLKMFPASVGEVAFTHEVHVKERGIACVDCHHQINAKKLATPHPDYFKSSWINCEICHNESKQAKPGIYACSACHQANTKNIADETLSAKVVIHQQCWKCHPMGTGKEASIGCEKCHAKKKP